MLEDRFSDLTPADMRTTLDRVRQADAVSGSGVDHDGFAPEPADRDRQAHGALWGCVTGVSLMASPISCYLYARLDEPLYALASVAFVAFSMFSLEFALRTPHSARAQAARDEGEPPGAVRDTIAPGGAYPYQLDNEPLVPTNVFTLRRK